MRHSSFVAEPSGVPSSKKARRYQSPSQPFALERLPQRVACARASARRVRARRRAPRRSAAKPGERGVQEPAEPDALALAAAPDAVHAVVPVARAHQRQAVRADREAASSARAQCSNSERRLGRSLRLEVVVRPDPGTQRRSVEERHHLVEHRVVAGDGEVAIDRVRQPHRSSEIRVRTPRPDGGCHQCCTSPSTNCWAAARSRCSRASSRLDDHQRHHVLQLIAEAVRAAGLIERRARPHAARQRLVRAASGSA